MTEETTLPSVTPLSLGTVQLGQVYGIANNCGLPTFKEAMDIMDAAWEGNMRTFDTARAYGEAESRIGQWIHSRGHRPFLVTKVSAIETDKNPLDVIKKSILHSMAKLGVDILNGILMHRASDLYKPGVIDMLNHLQNDGKIGGFGVSSYQVEELISALNVPGLSLIQAPFNLFDRRLETSGVLDQCKELGIMVFVRSVFLQGLFYLNPEMLPSQLDRAAEPLRKLQGFAKEINREVGDLALQAVKGTGGISSLIIGGEKTCQISGILDFDKSRALTEGEREAAFNICQNISETIYHPGSWFRKN